MSPRSFCTRSAPIFSTPQADAPAFAARSEAAGDAGGVGGALSSKLGMTRLTMGSAASASMVAGLTRTSIMFLSQKVLTTWSPRDSTSWTTGACAERAVSDRAVRTSLGWGVADGRLSRAPSTTTASTRSSAPAPGRPSD